jgi:hypothetical protein
MTDPETTLEALRDWLEHDPSRRAKETDHPYNKGWDDGWDTAREEVRKLLGQCATQVQSQDF